MNIKLGVIMDPIEGIKIKKDTTFAMLLEAQRRAYEIYYLQTGDVYLQNNKVKATTKKIKVQDDSQRWFELSDHADQDLNELNVVLMRKDPPFDMQYIYTTYLLDRIQAAGTLVVNHPTSLRNTNEKFFATEFPDCIAPCVVSPKQKVLDNFIDEYQEVVVKPLDGMAGDSVFRIQAQDPNRNVILETITNLGKRTIIAQKFIHEYKQGDKRILLINGEAIPYALVRIPAQGELRANLAKGGHAQGAPLTERDQWICSQLQSKLIELQLSFVGIDIIGEYLTEINITSPTGVRELDAMYNINICAKLFDHIESMLGK